MSNRAMVAVVAAVLGALMALPSVAIGAAQVGTTLSMPVDARASATASGCYNNPGPQVTLRGELALGGLGAVIIFRNNVKGTHENVQETTASVTLIPEGESISIPKQPVLGGAGGNPFIWVQFVNADGDPLSGELFLGRCVQGLNTVSASFSIPFDASLTVDAEEDSCTNNPGPWITLSGELALSGVNARIIFRNNDNPVGGPHKATVTTSAEIVLIPEGETIQIPKQPVLGGVGGNPWIWVAFTDGDGAVISEEFLLGRCVQDV